MESFVIKFSQFLPYTVLKRVSGCNCQIWCPSVSLSFWTLPYLLLLWNEDANAVVKVAAAAPYDAPLLLLVLHFPEKEFRLFTALFRRRCTLPLSLPRRFIESNGEGDDAVLTDCMRRTLFILFLPLILFACGEAEESRRGQLPKQQKSKPRSKQVL